MNPFVKLFGSAFLFTLVLVVGLTLYSNILLATTDGMREWLWDKPGNVYDKLYINDTTIVLARIQDCDGNTVWLIGGMLSEEDQHKYGIDEYTWMYAESGLAALSLLAVYFNTGEVVEVATKVPTRLCGDVL